MATTKSQTAICCLHSLPCWELLQSLQSLVFFMLRKGPEIIQGQARLLNIVFQAKFRDVYWNFA